MDTKEQASQPALQTLKEYAVITAAVLIMDIGIYVFKFPNNFSFGGVSGMAVVICRFLPFTASQINLFINLLLLLVGFAVLGRNFGVKTAYVTVLSSVLLNIFEKLPFVSVYYVPIAILLGKVNNFPLLEFCILWGSILVLCEVYGFLRRRMQKHIMIQGG